jgi:hypothetical protein
MIVRSIVILCLLPILLIIGRAIRVTSSGAEPLFRDVSMAIGLDFQHDPAATGQYLMPEIMGAGCALFDYDGDGDLDLFLVQGMEPEGMKQPPKGRLASRQGPARRGHRLYRNELVPSGKLSLTDVSERAGINRESYGMGVAAGDIDGDGDQDLVVTGYGPDLLFRNNGNGTFTESGQEAGIADRRWSTSAAFLDYDRDGDLDLYVTNYVDYTVAGNKRCTSATGEIDYCTPAAYRPVPDLLYRNDGRGRFTDVTIESKIGSVAGPGLGVTAADFDGDGWTDIYVANDGAANLLWINQRNGTFIENGLLAGAAYAMSGIPRAGMGATAGDFDNDGDQDILVTNLTREGFTLFRNNGRGLFDDSSDQVGLSQASFRSTGFGVSWIDYDNDGWLDLFAANGAVTMVERLKGRHYPYHQPNQLFHNEAEGRILREIPARDEPMLQVSEVSRGAAFGDIDNDGDVDILLSNNRGPARVLLNQAAGARHWLGVRLRSATGNRDGIGAVVTVRLAGARSLTRYVHTDGSYLSASDPRLCFGLGANGTAESLTVRWPDGREQVIDRPPQDRLLTIRPSGE